jgi:nucleotide-binding universal stress UspA family protein
MEQQSIVVGTDGSRAADGTVRRGAALARAANATLHIVTAYRELTPTQRRYARKGLPEGLDLDGAGDPAAAAKAIAEDAAHSVRHRGIKIRLHVIAADPARALCQVAERVQATAIIVGNRGARNPLRAIYRPIFARVQRSARCEVHVLDTEPFRARG